MICGAKATMIPIAPTMIPWLRPSELWDAWLIAAQMIPNSAIRPPIQLHMYNVPKEEKWDFVCNSLLGSCNAAYRRDEARKMGCDAFNIIYASISYQDWVRIALEVINPIVDLVDVISDPKNMVWPKEGAYIFPRFFTSPMLRSHQPYFHRCRCLLLACIFSCKVY